MQIAHVGGWGGADANMMSALGAFSNAIDAKACGPPVFFRPRCVEARAAGTTVLVGVATGTIAADEGCGIIAERFTAPEPTSVASCATGRDTASCPGTANGQSFSQFPYLWRRCHMRRLLA